MLGDQGGDPAFCLIEEEHARIIRIIREPDSINVAKVWLPHITMMARIHNTDWCAECRSFSISHPSIRLVLRSVVLQTFNTTAVQPCKYQYTF